MQRNLGANLQNLGEEVVSLMKVVGIHDPDMRSPTHGVSGAWLRSAVRSGVKGTTCLTNLTEFFRRIV